MLKCYRHLGFKKSWMLWAFNYQFEITKPDCLRLLPLYIYFWMHIAFRNKNGVKCNEHYI